MAAYDFEKETSFITPQQFDKVGTGVPVPVQRKFFCQRAYNTSWGTYETWISEGSPNPNPPSGDAITGLTTVGFWKQVV